MVKDLRLVLQQNGRLDAGIYHKPVYAMLFEYDGRNCKVPVRNNGERRPLGRDVIEAMRPHIERKAISEEAVLNCRILE